MDKTAITDWALANGWRMLAGCPSLTKPSRPNDAIVRLSLKTTVATLEIRKPAGKWEKVASQAYAKIAADPDNGLPRGLGFEAVPGLTMLMRDNKDQQTFARMAGPPGS